MLVLDYRLHEESGADVMARLQAYGQNVPVVVVAGDTTAPRLRELAALGVAVLHKPVEGPRLADALMQAVRPRAATINV